MGNSTCRLALLLLCLTTSLVPNLLFGQAKSREEKVREDRRRVEAEGFWIYNDLARGFELAKETGKPLLVILRCIPCEECVKLDDELVDQDPVLRPLLTQFVCVRQVSTNSLDLSLFQFDTDQSFAVFMLNGDGTIYGRFGTRSHRTEWLEDVSLAGMAAALNGALALHAQYPNNREQLLAKQGPAPGFATPEKFPSLREKYTDKLAETGNIVASCIHCHQIGDAERNLFRTEGKPLPDTLLFPYPHPKVLGLTMDPDTRGRINSVAANSVADRAGLQAGDEIVRLQGQPILSTADLQWVLHHTPASGGTLEAAVRRGQALQTASIQLPDRWRTADDISWRVSTWGLRRMVTGGLSLESTPAGLKVKHVGQYGPHAAAKNAGFQVGDVIKSWDGQADLRREADVLQHSLQKRRVGDTIQVVVTRGSKELTLSLPQQE